MRREDESRGDEEKKRKKKKRGEERRLFMLPAHDAEKASGASHRILHANQPAISLPETEKVSNDPTESTPYCLYICLSLYISKYLSISVSVCLCLSLSAVVPNCAIEAYLVVWFFTGE